MENDEKIKVWDVLMIGIVMSLIAYIIYIEPKNVHVNNIETKCKDDSLKQVINQLQAEIKSDEDGWDNKEQRYDDILFEYEYGVDHLKQTHPDAYREFHRVIGYKERYTREAERENKKRLNIF